LERRRVTVEQCLWVYAFMLVSLTAISWAFYLGEGRAELLRPLFHVSDRFGDLTIVTDKIAHLKDGAEALGRGYPIYNYPAPAAYVYAFLLRGFPHHPVGVYVSILLTGLVLGSIILWKSAEGARRRSMGLAAAIAATTVFGFPMWFTVDRANLEGAVALFLGIGLVLFVMRRYWSAAAFIGLAASIKPFPCLFFLLYLRKRLYREGAFGVAVAACSVLAALTALGPNPIVALRGLQPGVERYYNDRIMGVPPREEQRFTHSIMDGLKSVASELAHALEDRKLIRSGKAATTERPQVETHLSMTIRQGQEPPLIRSSHYAQIHQIFLLSMFIGAVAFVFVVLRVFRLPVLNQMILISVAITLLPPDAGDYTLLHLYVPFGVFLIFLTRDVATGRVEFKPKQVMLISSLFALVLSPLTFFERFSGDVRMILLVILLIVVGKYPMPSSIFKETGMADPHESPLGFPASI
jgi:hypothetical protein